MEMDTSPFPVKMNGNDLKIELVKTKDEKKKKKYDMHLLVGTPFHIG